MIVSSYADPAVIVYDTSGKELWRNSVTGAQVASMEVADLDGDGESEVLVGRASHQGLTCFNSYGAVRWT